MEAAFAAWVGKRTCCHSRAGGNPEKHSHPEFISGSTKKDAETSSA
ncbi:hypothetical protein [Rickettsia endosymbiont of Halotydeus destructor]